MSFGFRDDLEDFLDDLRDDIDDFKDDMEDLKDDLRDSISDIREDLYSDFNSNRRSTNKKNKAMQTFLDLADEAGLPVRDSYPTKGSVVVFNNSNKKSSSGAGHVAFYNSDSNGGENMFNANYSNMNSEPKYPFGQMVFFVVLLFVRFLLAISKDSIVIGWSIKGYSFLVIANVVLMGLCGGTIALKSYLCFKQTKLLAPPKKKQVSLSMKKNISKEDLMSKLNELLSSWKGLGGEEGLSYPYIQRAKKQVEDLDKIQSTLSLLVDNNDESSLSEVFNVIRATEEQIIKNIVSMINHIKVELSIDGYDKTNIEDYLDNNDIMIQECSKLLKASLLYMDGKAGAKGIQEYIESMVETLNKLKKEN